MIGRLFVALRLQLLVQARSFFPHIYFALAVLTILAFRFLLPDGFRDWLLPPLLLGEPALLGLSLVAAQRYLEMGEGSTTALVVTPLRNGEYVAAMVLVSGLQATIAGGLLQAGVLGFDARVLLVLPPLFLMAVISGLVGLALSTYTTEFTRFIMICLIPATILGQAPLLAYFGLVPDASFVWLPGDPALKSFAMLSLAEPGGFSAGLYVGRVLQLVVWTALAFAWALWAFRERVRGHLEEA